MSEAHARYWPKLLPRNLSLPQSSLWQNAEVSAARFPDKEFLFFYDTPVTYATFRKEAEQLAGYLQRKCGVRRGDRVALYLHNSPQFVIAYYATLRADAVVVPISPMYLGAELEQIVRDSGANVIVATQDLFAHVEPQLGRALEHAIIACYRDYLKAPTDLDVPPMIAAARQAPRGAGVTLWSEALSMNLAPGPHLATADDFCVMPYTSGTTGRPKGCVHRHRNVMHTTISGALWYQMNFEDRGLAVLPLFHVTGMQGSMNAHVYLGSSIVLMSRWNRDTALRLIERHRVTRLGAVPAMLIDLLSTPDLTRNNVSSLRSVGGGGAAMPKAIAEKLQTLCGLSYIEGYGMSETMAPTHLNPDHRPKPQCLGIPIFNTESRVVDPDTLVELPPGEVGEIVSHGPQVFDGYWNNPTATAESFIQLDGKRFLRTGDLGRTDEDGYFFFVDRIKRMINAAGFKVWPAEVESLLHAHPAIKEAVVIAKRDPRSGECVKALVVLKERLTTQVLGTELIEWARRCMAAYKVPREVEIVNALPHSPTGKVDWRALQERENGAADS